MNMITSFIISFCFGFIIDRARQNSDIIMVVVAIIGIFANVVLVLIKG